MSFYVTAPERARMRRMRAEGASVVDICAATDRSHKTVLRHVGDIPPTTKSKWHGAPVRTRVVALHEKGLSTRQIAGRLAMRANTVCVHLYNHRRAMQP